MKTTKASAKSKPLFRILFQNHGSVYELYARKVTQSELYAFVTVEHILFGERSHVLVDPSEERLKTEFQGVDRTHIPLGAVIRVDEVSREGVSKIHAVGEKGSVSPFPPAVLPRTERP